MRTSNTRRQAPQPDYRLEARLDALVCGDCTEEEFVSEALELFNSKSSAYLISRVDHYYQRGQLPEPLFRSIKSKITQRVLTRAIDEVDDVVTSAMAESAPAPESAVAPTAAGRTFVAEAPSAHDHEETAPAAAPPEALLPFGRIVRHRYAVLSHLGRGATADVYKTSDECRGSRPEAERHIALKILQQRYGQLSERREELRLEFNLLRRLAHPFIVKAYEFDDDEDTAFYTMEVIEGERLSDLMARAGHAPPPRAYAWAIVRALGAALAHAHGRGVVHGAVSARNVLIGAGGELRLLGFGSPLDLRGAICPYASCEIIEGQPADARDDVYALACLACELLGGAHPFQGRCATEARASGVLARRPRGIEFSKWRTLRRGLSFAREERPASIHQWLAELGLEPEPDRLPSIDQDLQRKPIMRVQHIAFAAALAVSALLGYFFVWHSIDRMTDHGAPAVADTTNNAPVAPLPDPKTLAPEPAAAATDADDAQNAAPQPAPAKAAPAAAPVRPTIKFAAKRLAVAPGTSFAEIHVFRSRPAAELNDFMWWTEDSSARSGVDFVAQDRTTHPFTHRSLTATIFVKLLPRADRTHAASFKVCAGKANGDAANDVTCSAVVLPARG